MMIKHVCYGCILWLLYAMTKYIVDKEISRAILWGLGRDCRCKENERKIGRAHVYPGGYTKSYNQSPWQILPNRRSLNNFLYIYVELFYWTNCF